MSEHEHVDADVRISTRQQMTWPVTISLATLALSGVGIYATLTANDRELYAGQVQIRQDLKRLEEEKKELKNEIRNDLSELKKDVGQVRDLLIQKLGNAKP